MNPNENRTLECVSRALRESKSALYLADIVTATGLSEETVRPAMRLLGQAGQVEVIHGGRSGNRYAWLNTKEEPGPASSPETPSLPPSVEQELMAHLRGPHARGAGPDLYQMPPEALHIAGVPTADRYLVCVPKRKPRIMKCPERAREAALAAVRNGAARAEVFALTTAGVARRGVQWQEVHP